ncbi:MAG TPA: secretin N-terminal domain-containing protein [Verrucomicrobiae bacterium]|nr:secretin N-terminal domain-containing protein [Verrucomicrobiae bacterium]
MNRFVVSFLVAGALACGLRPARAAEAATTVPADPSAATPAMPLAEGEMLLNFRGVPLEMVLNYFSEAAGFIIVKETEVKGKLDMWSKQLVTKDEAVDLLNAVLHRQGYAALRNGRILTIIAEDGAKQRDLPVKQGGNAREIPKSDTLVTQIVPVRAANVTQLLTNLRPLIGAYAEMSVNESANSLLITATQADIKRLTEIINALDESISGTSLIKVYSLKNADAKALSATIKELFTPTQTGGNNNRQQGGGGQGGFFFGGPGGPGGFGGLGGGQGGANNNNGSGGNAISPKVVAVADERSNSMIIAAPEAIIPMIDDLVGKVDQPVNDITELRVSHLKNADPVELADTLGSLFPDDSKSGNGNDQNPFRFGPPGFNPGGGNNNNNSGNTTARAKQQTKVVAVADQRTSSLIVSAASALMPHIAEVIERLDGNPARKQRVYVYNLENADPQAVQQILQDMFQKSTTSMNRNTANQNSALTSRIQQNVQSMQTGANNSNSGFGNLGGGSGVGNIGGQR